MPAQPSTAVVGTYQDEHEAELARAVLESNGVPAVVLRDNAGGMLPMLHMLFQARLVVAAENAAIARDILDGAIDAPLDDDDVDTPFDEESADDDANE